ncbi:hypothetical protein [Streptomyces sp. NPDC015414]|uniref:Mu transposase domain-containing protein n=1 Tax=Streptomyces sp. NPDC015414 TaxID=3364957 RepID=UPI0036F9402D
MKAAEGPQPASSEKVAEAATLEELNAKIAEIDAGEDEQIPAGRLTTVGFNFYAEADQLAPLPLEEFECGITLTPKVDRSSRITVRQCHYSVPARFIGQNVRVLLRTNELLVFERWEVVARHPRLARRGDFRDELDHYLEILLAKPGAMAGSTPLVTARQNGSFTEVHEAFWAAARAAHSDAAGTRALIEVLLLHRRMPASAVEQGMAAAIRAGAITADVVAVEARRAAAAAPHHLRTRTTRASRRPGPNPAGWSRSRPAGPSCPRTTGRCRPSPTTTSS